MQLEAARQRAEWERAAFIGWQVAGALVKMPSYDRYLEKLGMGQGATGVASQGAAKRLTDEEIIARAEAALRYWQAHPEKMQKVMIH